MNFYRFFLFVQLFFYPVFSYAVNLSDFEMINGIEFVDRFIDYAKEVKSSTLSKLGDEATTSLEIESLRQKRFEFERYIDSLETIKNKVLKDSVRINFLSQDELLNQLESKFDLIKKSEVKKENLIYEIALLLEIRSRISSESIKKSNALVLKKQNELKLIKKEYRGLRLTYDFIAGALFLRSLLWSPIYPALTVVVGATAISCFLITRIIPDSPWRKSRVVKKEIKAIKANINEMQKALPEKTQNPQEAQLISEINQFLINLKEKLNGEECILHFRTLFEEMNAPYRKALL
tara:strand:- start:2970 stop:3845 length:876 start_codon:yes stop_codon:yes gene_type:complete